MNFLFACLLTYTHSRASALKVTDSSASHGMEKNNCTVTTVKLTKLPTLLTCKNIKVKGQLVKKLVQKMETVESITFPANAVVNKHYLQVV